MSIRIASYLFAVMSFVQMSAPLMGAGAPRVLDEQMHHLRIDGNREWDEFPEHPEAASLELQFTAEVNPDEQTLFLRQQDVKQLWRVRLNGKEIGRLFRDENDMRLGFPIPPRTLKEGSNLLEISQDRGAPDDIRVGDIQLKRSSIANVLGECTIEVQVLDDKSGQPLPARITVTRDGALQMVDVAATPQVAVRPGTVFTSNGRATIRLPAGEYIVYAGRGFEYSLASLSIELKPGQQVERTLRIQREVPTPGYVACDPHIHTLTHSGHGDATVTERMVTIAAEGIELAVATDHNRHVDHSPFAASVGVEDRFTTVIGNEVTTPVGHFNVFPVVDSAPVPNHKLTDWDAIFTEIANKTSAPIVILNHARDLHSGIRPFGPKHFLAATGRSMDQWPQSMNGMEVINSGATQTDVLQLFQDWMCLLNRGVDITPVGSSDSHDVARHFVGQGRTYLRCDDSNPGAIDVATAVESFRRGQVRVSYGLLAEISIGGKSSGESVAATGETVAIDARVLGPHWVTATNVDLYMNGLLCREQAINPEEVQDVGVKWSGRWTVPQPSHDVHVVIIARGPGIPSGYWATAKPYQPTGIHAGTQVLGCSGALWIDADGDGKITSAHDYAVKIWDNYGADLNRFLQELSPYDAAIAAQAVEQYHLAGNPFPSPVLQASLKKASPQVQAGFDAYLTSWRAHELSKTEASE